MAKIARWSSSRLPSQRLHTMVGTPDNASEHRIQAFSLDYDYQIREVAWITLNVKLAVEQYSLELLRLELPISDGKKKFRPNPLSSNHKRIFRMLCEAMISICCLVQGLKKDRAGECNARYASRSHRDLPERVTSPWKRWKKGAYWTIIDISTFDARSTEQPAMRRMDEGLFGGGLSRWGPDVLPSVMRYKQDVAWSEG